MVKICDQDYPTDSKYSSLFDEYSYPLSDFQKYAIEAIVEGQHVLVTAHTGSGKTLPAEFAINHFVKQKKRVIYTSPIKALSNQKYSEFSRKYPHISFGLMTGDIKTNPEADVLIMTTDILMNALFLQTVNDDEQSSSLDFTIDIQNELTCVVFDEVHYINDADRGQTWEKTILMLPPHIQMVMLSATIDSPERFAKWAERGDKSKQVYLASTNKRVVPLTHYGFLSTNEGAVKLIKDKATAQDVRKNTQKLIQIQDANGNFNEDGYKTLSKMDSLFKERRMYVKRKHALNNLAYHLKENDMLPAIAFVFSRKNVEVCASEITVSLLEDDSKIGYTVRKECEQIVRRLPNFSEYLELPEYNQVVSLLEKGIGIHHSGMIPILREIVEIMISKKYIKLLFATESFAIGLDCPIKTAVFTGIHKFDGHTERMLMPHEYTQMAGRAGRRGIDTIGHVVHCNSLFKLPPKTEYSGMLGGKPQSLISKFRISYSLILNLIKNNKSKMCDFVEFVQNSMIFGELNKSVDAQIAKILTAKLEYDVLIGAVDLAKTPREVCDQYNDCKLRLTTLSNKKKQRKDIENTMKSLETQYGTCKRDAERVSTLDIAQHAVAEEEEGLVYWENYISDNIQMVCDILVKEGFIDALCDTYTLTEKGKMGANIAEIHPLIVSDYILQTNWFSDLSTEQLVGVIAAFTNVNIPSDIKQLYPHSEDELIRRNVEQLQTAFQKHEDIESESRVYSGFQYEDALCYDMPDLVRDWCDCDTEPKCKVFIQSNVAEKGISVGDFTKALLKVSTIGRELSNIAEMCNEVECLHKLSLIDNMILKYITTSQSLYV